MFLNRVNDSPAYEIFNQVAEKRANGETVFSLAIGEPSFNTPREIIRSAYESMEKGEVHYTSSYGTAEVRNAIVRKVRRKNRIHAKVENTIFLTTKLAVFVALISVMDGRYEALVPDPGYYYSEPVILSGGKPVRYRLADDFDLELDEIVKKITPKTRAIILNTPSNPTGKVIEKKQLQELLDLCRERGVHVISDESYEDLVYEKRHLSIGSLEESPEFVVSLFSLSKSYAMTGWRAGYAIGDEGTIRKMNRFLENTMTCFPQFIQTASAYALERCDRYVAKFREELHRRRDLLEQLMQDVPALEFQRTEGAFYSFPKFESPIGSVDLSKRLLDRYNVAVLPGAIFGPSGEGHLRISFSGTPQTIKGGMKRLRTAFKRLVPPLR